MKTTLKPAVAEVARYSCDVTGDSLPNGPVASLTIQCGYGSHHDGDTYELHLSGEAAEVVLPLLRSLLFGGGPLEPHRTEALFLGDGVDEKTITRRERVALLRRLEKLVRSTSERKAATKIHRGKGSQADARARLRGNDETKAG